MPSAYTAACKAVNARVLTSAEDLFSSGAAQLTLNGHRTMELLDQRIVDFDFAPLAVAIGETKQFTSVDLSYNELGAGAAESLAQLIKSDSTIAALDLSQNDFSDQTMDHVCESLKVNGTIRELALSGNAIGGPGGMAVAEMLQSNTALVRLEMGNCGLSTESLVALATVLRDNVTLQALDVSRPLARTVMDEPAAHFARMLKVNATLRDLDLSKAGLRDFGLQLLAEELYRAGAQSGLRRLGLRCNQLELSDDSCAQALHNLLGSDVCQLQVLDLGGNRLHDYGAHRLAEMIGDNVSLRSLDVSSNGLMSRGLCAIAHYTGARAPGELELNLWGNHFDTAAASKFEKHPCAFDFKVQLVDGTYHTVQAN